jgi:hypothetical protein
MTERIRREGRGGKALWTAPTKERRLPSKKRRTGSALSMNMKEERTRKIKDMKGGRTRREGGHERRTCDRWWPETNSTHSTSMVKCVLFGNSLGHPASLEEKTKEEGGYIELV